MRKVSVFLFIGFLLLTLLNIRRDNVVGYFRWNDRSFLPRLSNVVSVLTVRNNQFLFAFWPTVSFAALVAGTLGLGVYCSCEHKPRVVQVVHHRLELVYRVLERAGRIETGGQQED